MSERLNAHLRKNLLSAESTVNIRVVTPWLEAEKVEQRVQIVESVDNGRTRQSPPALSLELVAGF